METIARPYARAAFQLAEELGEIGSWAHFLFSLATSLKEQRLAQHLMNPTVSRKNKISLLFNLLSEPANDQQSNFLQLLLANGRIAFLPTIANLFEEMKLKKENELIAQVQTAFPLEEGERHKLIGYLSHLSGKKILLKEKVVRDLKAGVVIDLDNESFNYSIKEKVNKLKNIF